MAGVGLAHKGWLLKDGGTGTTFFGVSPSGERGSAAVDEGDADNGDEESGVVADPGKGDNGCCGDDSGDSGGGGGDGGLRGGEGSLRGPRKAAYHYFNPNSDPNWN